jgi:hypothetical protein
MDNFTIVIFKNKTKKRIIKKFKTYENAKKVYQKILEDNKSVLFGVETENGKKCKYEIALVSKNKNDKPLYVKDDFGRQVKIDLDSTEYSIIDINQYKKEESIYDIKKSKRIKISTFLRQYLPKIGVKLVSKLNHKISVQNESDITLFSLKSDLDCDRFIDSMSSYFMENGRIDTIFVKDTSVSQKKYLYDLLESNGYSKSILYRRFTTYTRE